MKFLQALLERHDDDIFDDLLDDLSVQTLMGDVAQAVNDGTPWADIAKNKHKYEDAAQTDVTSDEWNTIIRVLKAGGRYAKMVGINEMHHEYEEQEEFKPIKYYYARKDKLGNVDVVGVWQGEQGGRVKIMSWLGHNRLPTSLANHMFMVPGIGDAKATELFKAAIQDLFFRGDEPKAPTKNEVLDAIKSVTKINDWKYSTDAAVQPRRR